MSPFRSRLSLQALDDRIVPDAGTTPGQTDTVNDSPIDEPTAPVDNCGCTDDAAALAKAKEDLVKNKSDQAAAQKVIDNAQKTYDQQSAAHQQYVNDYNARKADEDATAKALDAARAEARRNPNDPALAAEVKRLAESLEASKGYTRIALAAEQAAANLLKIADTNLQAAKADLTRLQNEATALEAKIAELEAKLKDCDCGGGVQ